MTDLLKNHGFIDLVRHGGRFERLGSLSSSSESWSKSFPSRSGGSVSGVAIWIGGFVGTAGSVVMVLW